MCIWCAKLHIFAETNTPKATKSALRNVFLLRNDGVSTFSSYICRQKKQESSKKSK